jgi:drug/metabolite transporter (DMT)-like permease
MRWSLSAVGQVLFAASAATGGYVLWNAAILHGNLKLLALFANTTPILAALFASLWLSTTPTEAFWIGAALVVLGSGIAGLGSRTPRKPLQKLLDATPERAGCRDRQC